MAGESKKAAVDTVVELARIPAEGLHVDVPLEDRWLAEALEGTEAEGREATAHVDLYQVSGQIDVRGDLVATLHVPCSRCLETAVLETNTEFRVTYLPEPDDRSRSKKSGKQGEEEVELTAEDLDVAYYSGTTLDLAEPVREQLLLALPMTVLCAEDCKGLCASCGGNRNMTACACQTPSADSRWDALKGLKLPH